MSYFFAALPILLILILMAVFRVGGHLAGPIGLAVGAIIAWAFFGLNWDVLWVSQAKGLLLSIYIILVLWPALLLYHLINQSGGIQAVALSLERSIPDKGLLLVVIAWAFSGLLEGITGFGLPVAIVSPLLVGLGVAPLGAVAAVAVGHSWAVTLGGMGVTYQTLVTVSGMDPAVLLPPAALVLGLACICCAMASALVLGQVKKLPAVLALAGIMAVVQYLVAVLGAPQIASFTAGIVGLALVLFASRLQHAPNLASPDPLVWTALLSYGAVAVLLALLSLPGPIHSALLNFAWIPKFNSVATSQGLLTPAASGQVYRWLLHPGLTILLVTLAARFILRRTGHLQPHALRSAWVSTWNSAARTSLGVVATIGLSTLMEHCGMTQLLAQGLAAVMQSAFPLTSPLVGVLGAFATGSNNNSNVLFVPLQKSVALLLGIAPAWLVASQTAGGSIGSMIAPAKLIVGCSTVGLQGREGEVLKRTLPYVLVIALILGAFTWWVTQAGIR